MNLNELKQYIKPLVFFGEMKVEVSPHRDGGHKIVILDHEEGQLVNMRGEVVDENYSSTTKVAVIYTDKDGIVGFIEHPFRAFTKANKRQAELLLSLVGKTIIIDS